jgi:hypothetical protein
MIKLGLSVNRNYKKRDKGNKLVFLLLRLTERPRNPIKKKLLKNLRFSCRGHPKNFLVLKVYFRKSLISQLLFGIFQKKSVDKIIFDEFYSFFVSDSLKNFEKYQENLVNMGVLKFTPPISVKTGGDPAKWL